MNLDQEDRALIAAAEAQLDKAYEPIWHTVSAAIRTTEGKIYTGMNVDASTGSGGGACAEMAPLSAAISAGDKSKINAIVAVGKNGVMSPCGVCRQTLVTHAPQVQVIVPDGNQVKKVNMSELLPYAPKKSTESA